MLGRKVTWMGTPVGTAHVTASGEHAAVIIAGAAESFVVPEMIDHIFPVGD